MHKLPRAYWVYSVGLLAILLALSVGIGFGPQSAGHHIEGLFVESAGRGLVQSATALAESLNRLLFEHDLQSRTIAQAPVLRGSDPDALATYLGSLKSTWPEYMNLHVLDGSGTVIGSTDPLPNRENAGRHAG